MEIEDIVKELISSEKDSRNIVQDAMNESKKMVKEAEIKGKEFLESKIDEANAKAREILKAAEEKTRIYDEELLDITRKKISSMREKYLNVRDEMIEDFISTFLREEKNG